MANIHRGEVGVDASGKHYTLLFSINSLCALEEEWKMGIADVAAKLGNAGAFRLGALRTIFRYGLLERHGEMTDEAAGAIITEIGLDEAFALVLKAFTAAFPKAAKATAGIEVPGDVEGRGTGPLNRKQRRVAHAAGRGRRS